MALLSSCKRWERPIGEGLKTWWVNWVRFLPLEVSLEEESGEREGSGEEGEGGWRGLDI